jgi:hypothetical protein
MRGLPLVVCGLVACTTQDLIGSLPDGGGPRAGDAIFGEGGVFFSPDAAHSGDAVPFPFPSGDAGGCGASASFSFSFTVDTAIQGQHFEGLGTLRTTDPIRVELDGGPEVTVRLAGSYRAPRVPRDTRVSAVIEVDARGEGLVFLFDESGDDLLYGAWLVEATTDLPTQRVAFTSSFLCGILFDACGSFQPHTMSAAIPGGGTMRVEPGLELSTEVNDRRYLVGNGASVDVVSETNPPCTPSPRSERRGYYVVEPI